MHEAEQSEVLAYLAASFPNQDLAEGAQLVWRETLSSPSTTRSVAMRAIQALRETKPFLPSFSEFLTEANLLARMDSLQSRERQTGTAGEPLERSCPECGLGRGWVEPSAGQTIMARQHYQPEKQPAPDDPEGQIRWQAMEAAIANTVRPCSRCKPELFERWRGKHFEVDHHCSECAELRSGSARGRRARSAHAERATSGASYEPF